MVDTSTIQSDNLRETFENIKSLEHVNAPEALTAYAELITRAQEVADYAVQVDSLMGVAVINKRHGAFYKALHQAGTALQMINLYLPNDNYRLAYTYKELGAIYADGFGKSSIALDYFFKGLNCNVSTLNLNFYNNIGSIYKDIGNYEESLKYLNIGREMVEIGRDDVILAFMLENLGGIYLALGDYDRAEKILLEAKEVTKGSVEHDYIAGFVYNTLACVYLKTDREKEALALIDHALEQARERNYTSVLVESLKNKSNYALQIGDDDLFIRSINFAITYTEEETLSIPQISCLKLLKDFYWSRKDFEKACLIADQILDVKAAIDKAREHNSVADLLEKRESEIMMLENKNRMIIRQKEELEQFAYIVAHDLKEPLRSIGSYSGLIKRRYKEKLDEEGEEFLNFILKSASHMYTMLEDLLQYATVRNDSEELNPIAPNTVIDDIVYRLKDKIQTTNTTVHVEKLPLTRIRPTHFSVLVENLLNNAIRFRVPERPLQVHIKAVESEEDICFSVSDNGKGIDPQYFQSIFQIFKRLNKKKYSGTGIGLSICKKIVEVYRGKIWVDSVPGEGSTFFFKISK